MVPYTTTMASSGGRKRALTSAAVDAATGAEEDEANGLLAGDDSGTNSDADDLAIAQSMTAKVNALNRACFVAI